MNKPRIRIYYRQKYYNKVLCKPFVWEWETKNMTFMIDYFKIKIIYK